MFHLSSLTPDLKIFAKMPHECGNQTLIVYVVTGFFKLLVTQ